MDAELLGLLREPRDTQVLTADQISEKLPNTTNSRKNRGFSKWPVGLAARLLLGALQGSLAENNDKSYSPGELVLTPDGWSFSATGTGQHQAKKQIRMIFATVAALVFGDGPLPEPNVRLKAFAKPSVLPTLVKAAMDGDKMDKEDALIRISLVNLILNIGSAYKDDPEECLVRFRLALLAYADFGKTLKSKDPLAMAAIAQHGSEDFARDTSGLKQIFAKEQQKARKAAKKAATANGAGPA